MKSAIEINPANRWLPVYSARFISKVAEAGRFGKHDPLINTSSARIWLCAIWNMYTFGGVAARYRLNVDESRRRKQEPLLLLGNVSRLHLLLRYSSRDFFLRAGIRTWTFFFLKKSKAFPGLFNWSFEGVIITKNKNKIAKCRLWVMSESRLLRGNIFQVALISRSPGPFSSEFYPKNKLSQSFYARGYRGDKIAGLPQSKKRASGISRTSVWENSSLFLKKRWCAWWKFWKIRYMTGGKFSAALFADFQAGILGCLDRFYFVLFKFEEFAKRFCEEKLGTLLLN